MSTWLLLTYKIPPEPSAKRVYIWRKLKRIGAVLYQDVCWILPSNNRTQEQFRWLAAEIIEMGGEASVWEANLVFGATGEAMTQRFIEQVEQPYREILKKLENEEVDLEQLSREYQLILSKDYFRSETGRQLREALLSRRGGEG